MNYWNDIGSGMNSNQLFRFFNGEIKYPLEKSRGYLNSAEREGFEPPVHCCTMVFKTTAFDHSAISPEDAKIKLFFSFYIYKMTNYYWLIFSNLANIYTTTLYV